MTGPDDKPDNGAHNKANNRATRTAIILSAGQGRRLLPLTADCPKCLLQVGGQTILQRQISALLQAGIDSICVVAGYQADRVGAHLAAVFANVGIQLIFNPFYERADNLASCWMARAAMDADFLLVNGDTLFAPQLLATLLRSPMANITLASDIKPRYDDDDMKVELRDGRVYAVSKGLPAGRSHAESIGLLYFRGSGVGLFRQQLDAAIKTPEGLSAWFLSVIDILAKDGHVQACCIHGKSWCEIDFPQDLQLAQRLFATPDS